jgi:hypothetical protein
MSASTAAASAANAQSRTPHLLHENGQEIHRGHRHQQSAGQNRAPTEAAGPLLEKVQAHTLPETQHHAGVGDLAEGPPRAIESGFP